MDMSWALWLDYGEKDLISPVSSARVALGRSGSAHLALLQAMGTIPNSSLFKPPGQVQDTLTEPSSMVEGRAAAIREIQDGRPQADPASGLWRPCPADYLGFSLAVLLEGC